MLLNIFTQYNKIKVTQNLPVLTIQFMSVIHKFYHLHINTTFHGIHQIKIYILSPVSYNNMICLSVSNISMSENG